MKRRAYLYFVLTFLLGILVGGIAVSMYGWYRGYWRRGPNKDRIVRRLTRELNLSNEQARQVEAILDEMIQKTRALRTQVDPQFEALRQESQNKTRAILNPEQRARFDEMMRRLEERRKKRPPPW
jgi:hypothetical protein